MYLNYATGTVAFGTLAKATSNSSVAYRFRVTGPENTSISFDHTDGKRYSITSSTSSSTSFNTTNAIRPAISFDFAGSGRTSESIDETITWELITDEAELENGIYVSLGFGASLESGTFRGISSQMNNNRSSVATTISNNVMANANDMIQLRLGVDGSTGYYSFFDSTYENNTGGYLYAASSTKNYLRTQANNDNNGLWTISIDSTTYEATIVAQGSNSRDTLLFNHQTNGQTVYNIFAAYSGTATNIDYPYIFKKHASSGTRVTVTSTSKTKTVSNTGSASTDDYDVYYLPTGEIAGGWDLFDFTQSRVTGFNCPATPTNDNPSQAIVSPDSGLQWQLVTNSDGLVNGDTYIFAYYPSNYTAGTLSNKYLTAIGGATFNGDHTIMNTFGANTYQFNLVVGTDGSSNPIYMFQKTDTTTYLDTDGADIYLSSGDITDLTDLEDKWYISFDGNNAHVQNAQNNTRYITYSYNSGNTPRFKAYAMPNASYSYVQLYRLVEQDVEEHYIGDDIKDLPGSLYNPNAIDAVGGVTFYDSYMRMDAGISDIKSIADWTDNHSSEGGIGKPFYATQYVSDAIVIYIPNLGCLDYGTLTFECTSSYEPKFIKGSDATETSIGFTDNRIKCTDDGSNNNHAYELSLNPYNIYNLCYCTLDNNGKIFSSYDTDGNKTKPAQNISESSIKTFVLVIGSSSGNCDVTNVEIEFNQIVGNMGNFGTIGYRTADYTGSTYDSTNHTNTVTAGSVVPGEVVNFEYTMSDSTGYVYAYVTYTAATNRYDITFRSSTACTLYVFNYDAERAVLYVNGTQYKKSYNVISITANNTGPWTY